MLARFAAAAFFWQQPDGGERQYNGQGRIE